MRASLPSLRILSLLLAAALPLLAAESGATDRVGP
jgi:hypothetical protein